MSHCLWSRKRGDVVEVPLIFFLFILAMVIGPMAIRTFYQNQERQRLYETLRLMVEKGQPISDELLATLRGRGNPLSGVVAGEAPAGLNAPPRQAAPVNVGSDLRIGAVLLAIALGFVGLGVALGLTVAPTAEGPMIGISAFPGCLGLAFVILSVLGRQRTKP